MTVNEIIKALERCGQHRECCYCNSVEECGNKKVLTASVLDLINRKDAEIERLNKVSEICGDCHKQYAEKIERAKSEAIKEFAEGLKEKATSTFYEERKYVDTDDIDNLVAEMVGDSDER